MNTFLNVMAITSPTEKTSFSSQGGIDYIVGALFILIGLLIFVLFNRKSKEKAEDYKKRQLEKYNENHKTKISDYKKTTLYLPFWERVKQVSPVMLCVLFIIMGISFITWTASGTPLFVL